jgi:hypothetical protein
MWLRTVWKQVRISSNLVHLLLSNIRVRIFQTLYTLPALLPIVLYTRYVKRKIATMLYRSFRHTRGLWRRLPIAIFVTFALVCWQEYNTLTDWLSSQNVNQEPTHANSDDLYYEQHVQWSPNSIVAHREKPHTEHAKGEHRFGRLAGSGHGSKAVENAIISEHPGTGDLQVPMLQQSDPHPSSDVHG